MLADLFESHGQFCAKYQWEVIVSVSTLTICMLSMDNSWSWGTSYAYNSYRTEETNAVDVIFMTIIRCVAVLYTYYQFRKLRKLGSNYILGIAVLFTVFSSFVFSSTVINILGTGMSDLKDALFFFVLVIDLSKASVLAQLALSSSTQKEVNYNIARGMALLGPPLTLDTLVGTLVISVGTLSGVKRLETLCWFACFSFVVNYLVFMTFYPACISLVLELSRSGSCGSYEKGVNMQFESPLVDLLYNEGHKPNPVVQRVKVIMSAGMMIVHAHSRWSLSNMENNDTNKMLPILSRSPLGMAHPDEPINMQDYLMRILTLSMDHIVIFIIILALIVKDVFFDDKEGFANQVLQNHSLGLLPEVTSVRKRLQVDKDSQTEYEDVEYFSSSCQTDVFESQSSRSSSEMQCESIHTQTNLVYAEYETDDIDYTPCRSVEECQAIYNHLKFAETLTDREIINLVRKRVINLHELERKVQEPVRGVSIRRICIGENGNFKRALKNLPYHNYDYTKVMGQCCENVLGYIPIPVGICGPLLLDGNKLYVPMATTEGCLVASTNRGCRAISEAGGASSRVFFDGMTRAPTVRFPSSDRACEVMEWINNAENFNSIKVEFDKTSRFARLQKIQVNIKGNCLYIRFTATTGDAMGMNMVSKGAERALNFMKNIFTDMEILGLSGNFCTDKKSSAVNWLEGRGKSVVCEVTIPAHVVQKVLKTTAKAMKDLNITKNLIGSSAAVTIGGFNAQAANIVTAIYIATGQDPAQNVCSSNCMTLMDVCGENGEDLYISCTMPSIEVGTVGGGTALPAQSSCLNILGVQGSNKVNPGNNAKTLARIICGAVMAGELSLMAALCEGHLVRSHLSLNRTSQSKFEAASPK